VDVGSLILLDDGAVEIEVLSKNEKFGEVVCIVLNSGFLGNKKGFLFHF
jgi:pyruvate kinase